MRAAGTLLTILALVAVQAPWIACACDGEASMLPLLAIGLAHQDAAHEHGDDHGHSHGCCDHIAHHVHGANHAHGSHCHVTFTHTHDDEAPEAPMERHDGFHVALLSMPGDVTLDADDAPAAFDALVIECTWHVMDAPAVVMEPDPPERPATPVAATERLLL